MKNIFLSLVGALATTAQTQAAQSFKGEAVAVGDDLSCYGITTPLESEAEADADRLAEAFCDTFGMRASRISDFNHSESGCLREGRGFAIHGALYTFATAEYRCIR